MKSDLVDSPDAVARPGGCGEDPDGVPSGWRRRVLTTFVVGWLAVQIVLPFVKKFELPSLRYRNNSTFSWSPYSAPTLMYELSLFVRGADGNAEPIPNVERYVAGLWSPGPVPLRAPNDSVEQVQERYARLTAHIARARGDDREYVAYIRWLKHYRPGAPTEWVFTTRKPKDDGHAQ